MVKQDLEFRASPPVPSSKLRDIVTISYKIRGREGRGIYLPARIWICKIFNVFEKINLAFISGLKSICIDISFNSVRSIPNMPPCQKKAQCVKKYFDKIGEVLRNVLKNIVTKSYKICDVGWSRFATSYLNAKSWISFQTFRDKYCFRTFHFRFPKDVYWNFQKMFQIRHRAKNGTADYGLTQCTDAQWRKNLSHFLTKLKLQSWKVMNWSESFAATSKLGDYYFVNIDSIL